MGYYYGGRLFRTVKNSAGGQVNGDTIFQYQQHHDRLTVTYSGGPVEYGHMLGWIGPGGHIDFVYHHMTRDGEIHSGKGRSRPETLSNGKLRLHEVWEWTCGKDGKGTSIVEEM